MVRMRRGTPWALPVVVLLAGCTGACLGPSRGGAEESRLTVFAAASLTESFTRLGRDFEAARPGTRVDFSFAGSSTLATQITQGAPADVFASADRATMTTVTGAGLGGGSPVAFARNRLVIAVPASNPRGIRSLVDLAAEDVTVALCARQVPCGQAARRALAAARVDLTPVTEERDVRAALAKVTLGEVDAALVYRTDVPASSGAVRGVDFPESARVVNDYVAVALRDGARPDLARDFVVFLGSPAARGVLEGAGFDPP